MSETIPTTYGWAGEEFDDFNVESDASYGVARCGCKFVHDAKEELHWHKCQAHSNPD